jgi:hypothetical protein
MRSVTTALREEAETIFSDLGYAVTADGEEIRAERKWRVVQVTPMPEPDEPPSSGEFRCFVTWKEQLADVEQYLTETAPDYDWAVIGVRDGEYTVGQRSE